MRRPWCERCGATRVLRLPDGRGCVECGEGWPEELARAGAPFRMEGDAARLVRALKFSGWFALAGPMGRAMGPAARRLSGGGGAALVPVPLAPARRRSRGFNQAALLARALARTTGWPVHRLLARPSGGRPQARLGRRQRRSNVRGRFALAGAAAADAPPPVLIVDDVLTTGATAGACAATLRTGGYRVLGAVAFARALHSSDPAR